MAVSSLREIIRATMAVAAAAVDSSDRAAFAREARVARLAALVVDAIVFGLITGVVNGVYGETEIVSGYISANGSFYSTSTAVSWPWLILLGLLYFAIPEAMFGASIGKQMMRLKVVSLGRRPPALRDVLIRNVLRPIDFLPVLYVLGGFLVLVTPGAQRLGDLVAGTSVVYRHRALEPGATRTSGPTARRVLVAVLAAAVIFTGLFDYFGRPPIVIDGLFKEQRLINSHLTSYSLGAPTWGFATVTYPLSARTQTESCAGSEQLEFHWFFGWTESTGQLLCRPI